MAKMKATNQTKAKPVRPGTKSASTKEKPDTKSAGPKSAGTKAKAGTKSAPAGKASKPTLDGVSDESNRRGIITPEDRQRMIQDAAYHLAEKDGFQAGREQDYWFRAEQQVDQLIKGHQVVGTGNQQIDDVDLAH